MKPKKLVKRLSLSKTTIANLEGNEQNAVRGGYWATAINTGCGTWHPICFTKPHWTCDFTEELPRCPFPVTDEICETIEIC